MRLLLLVLLAVESIALTVQARPVSYPGGWTPYKGDYGDLHTWLMFQVDHMPEADNNLTVTPLVRFFKNVHLLEVGVNNRGKLLFNYVFRY